MIFYRYCEPEFGTGEAVDRHWEEGVIFRIFDYENITLLMLEQLPEHDSLVTIYTKYFVQYLWNIFLIHCDFYGPPH